MENLINKDFTYAIVGASNNTEKYGYKVLKQLLDAGYKTIPINPKGEEILNQKTYKTIDEITEKIDVAVFVTQPETTETIIKKLKNIKIVWLQPGSENDETIYFCKKNNIECIHNACILIAQRNQR